MCVCVVVFVACGRWVCVVRHPSNTHLYSETALALRVLCLCCFWELDLCSCVFVFLFLLLVGDGFVYFGTQVAHTFIVKLNWL